MTMRVAGTLVVVVVVSVLVLVLCCGTHKKVGTRSAGEYQGSVVRLTNLREALLDTKRWDDGVTATVPINAPQFYKTGPQRRPTDLLDPRYTSRTKEERQEF